MQNISNIQKQFNEVISYSQGIYNVHSDELFAKWKEAKSFFFEAFNGQLIYEYPQEVTFELSKEAKHSKFVSFIEFIENVYSNRKLSNFLWEHEADFFNNRLSAPYELSSGKKLPVGMKILKALKFFEDNPEALDHIQTKASMLIQEEKVTGKICLSVHPLDFLSTSENTYKWRSCHALDGEYRSGNLSYMTDQSTVICYLKSTKENQFLPNFPTSVPWNSKKWRVLLFFSNDRSMMFAGRQYPFTADGGLNFITEKLLTDENLGRFGKWSGEKIREYEFPDGGASHLHNGGYVGIGNRLITMSDLIKDEKGSLHFNDLLHSSCYDPVYSYRMDKHPVFYFTFDEMFTHPTEKDKDYEYSPGRANNDTRFYIGGPVPCLSCGEYDIDISERMVCESCDYKEDENIYVCPCCGNHFYVDDGYWIESEGTYVCPDCAESECTVCDICGELVYNSDIIYDRENEKMICRWCKEEMDAEVQE